MSVYTAHNVTVSIDSDAPIISMKTCLLTKENTADQWNITVVNEDGTPYPLAGKGCTAKLIRRYGTSDADTVVINGTVSGSTATVTLPQACYAYAGTFQLSIIIAESSTVVRVIYACVGAIAPSESGQTIDPGSVVPDITALLAQISTMRTATAECQAAIASVNNNHSTSDDVSYIIG